MSEPLCYLACPFNHPDPLVREKRYEAVTKLASSLMQKGHLIFSPLSHSSSIIKYGLPIGWDFWGKFNRSFLTKCDKLLVLKLDGWKESEGVQAELRIARELGIPIEYIESDKTKK